MMGKNLIAFILAAGFSSRMGMFKPLLPLGDTFVLEYAVTLFRKAGVNEIRVVTGYRAVDLEPVLRVLGVRSIENARFKQGMFSSVQAAVQTLDESVDAFFILPVDIPLVRPTTIHSLIDLFRQREPDIAYPCFLEERGHPPLISRRLVRDIRYWEGSGGLRAVLAKREKGALDWAVPDGNILLDMDVEEDYRMIKEKFLMPDIPNERECQALMIIFNAQKDILNHSQAVSKVAVKLGKALNKVGSGQDLNLLKAAGLLHDIAKGQPDHAERGAEMIRHWGFPAVADVVRAHTDIVLNAGDPIREREILYLADKLVRDTQAVSLRERFMAAQQRYGGDPAVSKNVERRLQNALLIQERIVSMLGQSVEELLGCDECRKREVV